MRLRRWQVVGRATRARGARGHGLRAGPASMNRWLWATAWLRRGRRGRGSVLATNSPRRRKGLEEGEGVGVLSGLEARWRPYKLGMVFGVVELLQNSAPSFRAVQVWTAKGTSANVSAGKKCAWNTVCPYSVPGLSRNQLRPRPSRSTERTGVNVPGLGALPTARCSEVRVLRGLAAQMGFSISMV